MSVTNIVSWIMTIKASTVDRKFPTNVILNNGSTFPRSLFYGTKDPKAKEIHALIYGCHAMLKNIFEGAHCETSFLNPNLMKGKIVVYM